MGYLTIWVETKGFNTMVALGFEVEADPDFKGIKATNGKWIDRWSVPYEDFDTVAELLDEEGVGHSTY